MLGPSVSLSDARSDGLWLRRWGVPVALLAAAVAALAVDCPLARWWAEDNLPGDLKRVLISAEGFGHGVGVVLIVLAIYYLDPSRRPRLPRVVAASLGAGVAANLIKMLVARSRPRAFDLSGGVWESFSGLFSLGAGGSGSQSFPSAHTATAVGFALALAWLYPRSRGLVAALALLVAFQRMAFSAHFLSDTLVGASVGWTVAMTLLPGGIGAYGFDRFEAWRMSKICPVSSGGQTCRSG